MKKAKIPQCRNISKSNRKILQRQNRYPKHKYISAHFPGMVQALKFKKVAGLN